jgi:hypothetical protein
LDEKEKLEINNFSDKSERLTFAISTILNSVTAGLAMITNDPTTAINSSITVLSNITGFGISKQLNKYVLSLGSDFARLETDYSNFKIENLKNNEMMSTVILQSIQIAIRNHQKEKHDALRNAVLNTAIKNENDDQTLTFLRYIDELTPLHIRILKFIESNKNEIMDIFEQNKDSSGQKYSLDDPLVEYLESHFPETVGTSQIYIRDLMNRSLVNWERMLIGHDLLNVAQNGLSTAGQSFLKYIESPFKIGS